MKMKYIEQSSVTIKSNVTVKNKRAIVPPIDNIHPMWDDVRYRDLFTEDQKKQHERSLFYVKDIVDENNEKIEMECFKGCENCGQIKYHCKHPQNKARRERIQ